MNNMFTERCFIRKNTKELRDKLMVLGHRSFGEGYEDADAIAIIGSKYCTDRRRLLNFPYLQIRIDFCGHQLDDYIDCGNNEDLFLSIAALRDDTDRNQWFVSDEGTFRFNKDDVFNVGMANYTNYCFTHWHKATVSELIEHFGKESL